jgi:hypothetical protein
MMAFQYYVEQDGAQAGPFDEEALAAMAKKGSLLNDTLVWRQGMADWELASTVSDLVPLLKEIAEKQKKERAKAALEKKNAELEKNEASVINSIINFSIPLPMFGGRDPKLLDAVQTNFFNAYNSGERNLQNLVEAAVQGVKDKKAVEISVKLKSNLLRDMERLPTLQVVSDGSGTGEQASPGAAASQPAAQLGPKEISRINSIISQSIPLTLFANRDPKLLDMVQTSFFASLGAGERSIQNLVRAAVEGVKGGKAAEISAKLKNGLMREMKTLPSLLP